jgi:hypothetical protein
VDGGVSGDEPLADGMLISVRVRRDFVVADAERFLRTARHAYIEITPGATEEEAAEMVTCAADAIFALIERAGIIGQELDGFLESADGLTIGGQAAQVTMDTDQPLPTGRCWFGMDVDDVFALPPGASRFSQNEP